MSGVNVSIPAGAPPPSAYTHRVGCATWYRHAFRRTASTRRTSTPFARSSTTPACTPDGARFTAAAITRSATGTPTTRYRSSTPNSESPSWRRTSFAFRDSPRRAIATSTRRGHRAKKDCAGPANRSAEATAAPQGRAVALPPGASRVPQTCRDHREAPPATGNHEDQMETGKPTSNGADCRDNLGFG